MERTYHLRLLTGLELYLLARVGLSIVDQFIVSSLLPVKLRSLSKVVPLLALKRLFHSRQTTACSTTHRHANILLRIL